MGVCFLRYENYTFIGQLSTDGLYTYITSTVNSPDVFNEAVSKLLSKLSAEATSGSGYASGITTDSLYRKIYGLVQCWKDISSDDCTTCLSKTINNILASFTGTTGAQGLMGSCIVRYEIYSFFNSTAPPPPSTEAPANDSAKQINKSLNKTPIILGVVGGFLLALLVCLFATGRRLKAAIKRRGYEGIFI
jgi:hypothetical protein